MGMNKNVAADINGAVRLFSDLHSMTDGGGDGDESRDIARQQARLKEQAARANAEDVLDAGEENAGAVREEGEQRLGRLRARASRSGLARSGSRALVDAARTAEAREDEQKTLDYAETQAREILRKGRREADTTRLAAGLNPRGTAIGLGAKLYRNRR